MRVPCSIRNRCRKAARLVPGRLVAGQHHCPRRVLDHLLDDGVIIECKHGRTFLQHPFPKLNQVVCRITFDMSEEPSQHGAQLVFHLREVLIAPNVAFSIRLLTLLLDQRETGFEVEWCFPQFFDGELPVTLHILEKRP